MPYACMSLTFDLEVSYAGLLYDFTSLGTSCVGGTFNLMALIGILVRFFGFRLSGNYCVYE